MGCFFQSLDVLKNGRKVELDTKIQCIKNQEKHFDALVVLFDNQILLAKQRKDSLQAVVVIPLRLVKLRDIDDSDGPKLPLPLAHYLNIF